MGTGMYRFPLGIAFWRGKAQVPSETFIQKHDYSNCSVIFLCRVNGNYFDKLRLRIIDYYLNLFNEL